MIGYILAAGNGSRIAPYGETRPKTLLPVVNRPVVSWILEALDASGISEIRIAADRRAPDVRLVVPEEVTVTDVGATAGSAESLASIYDDSSAALVVPGDVIVSPRDLRSLADAARDALDAARGAPDAAGGAPDADGRRPVVHLLLSPIPRDETGTWIGVRTEGDEVTAIVGHPRGGVTHRIAGFALPPGFARSLARTPTRFPAVEVGMMPAAERYLESAVESWRANGGRVRAVYALDSSYDLDKPWDLLTANERMLDAMAGALSGNRLDDGATIDPTAQVDGHVVLGRNSRVGRNVVIRGDLIAGDDVTIDSGAIINGTVAVGDGSSVRNGCFVEGGSVIGRNCVVSHAAELDGLLFDGVYLYHYMEIYGIVGENTDIGAATVCGSLRFDDGRTAHRIRGRREVPRDHSNASFIGDFCRTGVNAILMPGCRIGPYSIVGPGVVLNRDVPPRTGVRVAQQLEEFSWGPERYGW
jgi:bifunctional UDP-N-acetylglucosamine pyrophosphorylase/glucosamine-1-phosphate N-acetyltransferase